MEKPLVYTLGADEIPPLCEIGGKGRSLLRLTREGLPVPDGFILSVEFFRPWRESVISSEQGQQLQNIAAREAVDADDLRRACTRVKELCASLQLDPGRRKVLARAAHVLGPTDATRLFAVRSSSPHEDLHTASFAGAYTTTLGVPEEELEEAIRTSFASCYNERSVLYRNEHGHPVGDPGIAVIVQHQILSAVSGVAFSVNPTDNCYDEVVINSSYGLGETVVSGAITPDYFRIHKPSMQILERTAGEKDVAVRVRIGGRTRTVRLSADKELSLTDGRALAVARATEKIERILQRPVDVEWALDEDALWILQARPVTAHVPLPEPMITAPGEQKRLYLDASTCTQGMDRPLSILGLEFMEAAQKSFLPGTVRGSNSERARTGFYIMLGGRMYLQLSNMMRAMGRERVAALQGAADSMAGEIIEGVPQDEYVPQKMHPELRRTYLGMVFGMLSSAKRMVGAYRKPGAFKRRFFRQRDLLQTHLQEFEPKDLDPAEFTHRLLHPLGAFLREWTLPMTYAAELARALIRRSVQGDSDLQAQLPYLEGALPENVTIEMGLAMHRLAQYAEIRGADSWEAFERRRGEGRMSWEFVRAWDRFMRDYGFRCPREVDAARPRPYEQSTALFANLREMSAERQERDDPRAVIQRRRARREEAYCIIHRQKKQKGRLPARAFAHRYRVLVEFGGYREIHKHYLVMATAAFRRGVLQMAKDLCRSGRLDAPEQIFDLNIADLQEGMSDVTCDLRARAEENSRFVRRLRGVRHFPTVIDSRGRIHRPPGPPPSGDQLTGTPISPGTAVGTVRVLRAPGEKPVLPGDILVARATDPGWTPLFINAGGVVLELGGVLQHGALVAREYGKPCVAGVENVTSLLRDGQTVEVDGSRGLVRILDDSREPA